MSDDPSAERRRFWLARKVSELRRLLERLPSDRQRAFSDMLDAASASPSDDRAPGKGEPGPGDDRAPTGRQTPEQGD